MSPMTADPAENVLFERFHAGERSAFDELSERVRPRLAGLVDKALGEGVRAVVSVDDVLQETWLRAFASRERFTSSDVESFVRWLGGIARNVILEAARRSRRTVFALGDDLGLGEAEPAADGTTASRASVRAERFERLEDALDQLSEEHRRVIVLARIERLSIAEVAKRLDRSPGATSQLLWRALRALENAFGSVSSSDSLLLPPRELRESSESDECQ